MFKMSLVKIVLFATAVYWRSAASIDNSPVSQLDDASNTTIAKLCIWLQKEAPYRGRVARPTLSMENLATKPTSELLELVNDTYRELGCSYLFSTLAHLYLTQMFLGYANGLTQNVLVGLSFTGEAQLALQYSHGGRKNREWHILMEAMFVFYMHSLRSMEYFQITRAGIKMFDADVLLSDHKAVETVLEELAVAKQCKVYDQKTGQIENIGYAEKVKEYISLGLTTHENKKQFTKQLKRDAVDLQGVDRFKIYHLRLDPLARDEKTMKKIIETYGTGLDGDQLADRLADRYKYTHTVNLKLHEFIDSLSAFQTEVLLVLQAIALRLVELHFLHLKELLANLPFNTLASHLKLVCDKYNANIFKHLSTFANHIGQSGREHWERVLGLLTKECQNYSVATELDVFIDVVRKTIEDMTTGHSGFEQLYKPLKNSNQNVEDSVEMFVAEVVRVTKTIDFEVINSCAALKESVHYQRLKQLSDGDNQQAELVCD